jgi:dihydrodipicolinate synthase/N-acetylneuraminate lyase
MGLPTDLTAEMIAVSPVAVPPIARNADLTINVEANRELCAHLQRGGVTSWLYGGNANFYNISVSEFEDTMTSLVEIATEVGDENTLLIPSVGPDYGKLMDQATILKRMDCFRTAMVLPLDFPSTADGLATGVRNFAHEFGKKVILYVKSDKVYTPEAIAELVDEGLIVAVKYAVVRDDPSEDEFLSELCSLIDPKMIISGIGERPAGVHMTEFGVAGFTSGSVCIAPRLSTMLLQALHAGDAAEAARIRELFMPHEDLRDLWSPIRTMHESVTLAGIADMGPMLPMLSNIEEDKWDVLRPTVRELLAQNTTAQVAVDSAVGAGSGLSAKL